MSRYPGTAGASTPGSGRPVWTTGLPDPGGKEEQSTSMMKELFMKPVLLLATGDAERCQVNRQFLTEQGYEVLTSADGLGCVQKVRKHNPAVVVLDLEL